MSKNIHTNTIESEKKYILRIIIYISEEIKGIKQDKCVISQWNEKNGILFV